MKPRRRTRATARPDTWMPIFWGDYARDTGHLSALMHGAYLMLIKHYWCTGKPLPDDDAQLWRIACCDSPAQWRGIKAIVAAFFVIAAGLWRHKRIDAELEFARQCVQARSDAGKKGAHSTWQRDSNDNGNAIAMPSVSQEQTAWQDHGTSPSPSPSPSPTGEALSSPTTEIDIQDSEIVRARGNGKSIDSGGSGRIKLPRQHRGRVDYSNPENRRGYADQRVAEHLGWPLVMAARSGNGPAAERCVAYARSIGIVWDVPDA